MGFVKNPPLQATGMKPTNLPPLDFKRTTHWSTFQRVNSSSAPVLGDTRHEGALHGNAGNVISECVQLLSPPL